MSEKAKNPIKWKGKYWWLPSLRSMLKEDDGTPAKLVTSVNGKTGDVVITEGGGEQSAGVTSFNGKTGIVTETLVVKKAVTLKKDTHNSSDDITYYSWPEGVTADNFISGYATVFNNAKVSLVIRFLGESLTGSLSLVESVGNLNQYTSVQAVIYTWG